MTFKLTHTDFHLLSMPYAQAHVRFYVDEFNRLNGVELYSYNSLVLTMDCDTWNKPQDDNIVVYCPVNYSPTTARQVSRFTTELSGNSLYHELKKGSATVPDLWFKCVELYEKYAARGRRYYK